MCVSLIHSLCVGLYRVFLNAYDVLFICHSEGVHAHTYSYIDMKKKALIPCDASLVYAVAQMTDDTK